MEGAGMQDAGFPIVSCVLAQKDSRR